MQSWNYSTFVQIVKACGDFWAVARKTLEMKNLLEAKIKIIYNYAGFVSASIFINHIDGNYFVVQLNHAVPPAFSNTKSGSKTIKPDKMSDSDRTQAKKDNSSYFLDSENNSYHPNLLGK